MKHRAAALAAATGGLLTLSIVASPAPAQASELCEIFQQCGDVKHKSPDNGFDDAFPVTCNWNDKWGAVRYLTEGQSANCHDTDGIYVGSGREVTCTQNGWEHWIKFDAVGWHKISDADNYRCVHGLD